MQPQAVLAPSEWQRAVDILSGQETLPSRETLDKNKALLIE